MKNLKTFASLLLTLALILALAACGGKDGPSENGGGSSSGGGGSEVRYHIGISQFGEHGSLDNCREGFLQLLLCLPCGRFSSGGGAEAEL